MDGDRRGLTISADRPALTFVRERSAPTPQSCLAVGDLAVKTCEALTRVLPVEFLQDVPTPSQVAAAMGESAGKQLPNGAVSADLSHQTAVLDLREFGTPVVLAVGVGPSEAMRSQDPVTAFLVHTILSVRPTVLFTHHLSQLGRTAWSLTQIGAALDLLAAQGHPASFADSYGLSTPPSLRTADLTMARPTHRRARGQHA